MKTTINCTKHLDSEHTSVWETTRELIERKHEHLRHLHPDLNKAELHLRAFSRQSEVHLLVHDSRHRLIEAHASASNLDKSISLAFKRAEVQLAKPKHLQNR
ncbi:HPF/RaiA family ribosome-associated protein [Roseibacillus ishigakijimensis]|uniref:HPF/RaiA family ribosome-associated protein n=1 Tax=Roseibacillus ishigakijimensis TaxID=454146 RepID=A0A934RLZ1_9BACT|nr:HPF/RaiA family ribosome-associated protein [Roseibacillus ishigakijimensis]MBK1833273.1 HPF/RaiA family ribosome-associated protein [Roseibacillus ishigakijimensis]